MFDVWLVISTLDRLNQIVVLVLWIVFLPIYLFNSLTDLLQSHFLEILKLFLFADLS